jgi:hypothetical protein
MNTEEQERSKIAEHFAQCLTKYLYTTRDALGKSFTLKVSPCELGTNYSVFLELNKVRALISADLDTVDAMDNESAWNNETIRIGDELLRQIRIQVEKRDKTERNDIILSGEVANVRKAILGDIAHIVRETKRVIVTKKGLSNGDKRHPYHDFPKDIRDVLVIIGDVIEIRLKQIERREEANRL